MSVVTLSPAGPNPGSLRQRLARREDSEHVQALIRVGFGLLISAYLYSTIGPRLDIHVVCIGFEVLSLAILAAIIARPQRSAWRRGLGAVLDLGTTTYLMLTNGEVGAPLYGIYLWVTFGNGFRYGVRSLYASQVMSLAGFGGVIAFNPFWHQHALMAGGFMILLAAVPLYGAVLLKGVTRAQDKAEQANEAKSRFLSVMSHEIRTPLNGIIGINALLRRTRVTPEQLDLINTLGSSSEILLSLLDNVLDIAKIEAGKMNLEQAGFDVHGVIHSAIKMAATQAAAKELRISACVDAAVPRMLIGDPHRLRQVMTNLLANSTKFTNRGGVHLRASLAGQGNGVATVRFEVIDTGVGISPEALSQIFQPFVQADQSTTRQFGGTGLGTTIARQLTELMNGRMGAESAPGEGSTFWFEVPFHTQRPGTESLFDGVRVLLVSHRETLEQELVDLLRGWHAEIATSDVERATRMIAAADQAGTPLHVILVDQFGLHLPMIDLDSALSNGKGKPRMIALGRPPPAADRAAMIRWPYAAVVDLPVTREALHRALNFAALDELEARAHAGRWEKDPAIGTTGSRPRVLVAEDNATNRKIIAQILEYGGFDVTLAGTGTQAIENLQRAAFDIVILDKHMPGMSGMEVAARYQDMRGGNAAPMIMLTAEATAEAMQECKAAGMQAFLTKPIDPEMLFETISALTGVGALHAEGPDADKSGRNEAEAAVADGPLLEETILSELNRHAYTPGFLVEVVNSFESDMLDLIERLDGAVKAEDWPEIAEIRHAIEGTARGSGAVAIAGLVGELKTLHAVEPAERRARIEKLRACFAATRKAMREFLSKRTTAFSHVENRAEPVIPSP